MDTMRFNKPRLRAGNASELYGLCLGVMADGYVAEAEIEFLVSWISARPYLMDDPVIEVLVSAIAKALEEGVESATAQSQILEALLAFTGAPDPAREHSSIPSTLPLCKSIPAASLKGVVFCCTGTFDLGTRGDCKSAIENAGGVFSKGVTQKVDYLVIGNKITPDWKQQSYGAKIIKAMEYRDLNNLPISIITETQLGSVLESIMELGVEDA